MRDIDAANISAEMKRIMEEEHMNMAEVARKAGLDYKTVYGFMAQNRTLNFDKVQKISRAMTYELSEILCRRGHMVLSEEEAELVHAYRRCADDYKEVVKTTLRGMEQLTYERAAKEYKEKKAKKSSK